MVAGGTESEGLKNSQLLTAIMDLITSSLPSDYVADTGTMNHVVVTLSPAPGALAVAPGASSPDVLVGIRGQLAAVF